MSRTIIGVDIDLHRMHAAEHVLAGDGVIMLNDDRPIRLAARIRQDTGDEKPLVLVECASPHQYGGRLYQKKLAWMIYNSAVLAEIAAMCVIMDGAFELRCSPSSTWTKGYPEAARHRMSGADQFFADRNKDDQHNLRECLAMIWFYKQTPDNWTTVHEFLRAL